MTSLLSDAIWALHGFYIHSYSLFYDLAVAAKHTVLFNQEVLASNY